MGVTANRLLDGLVLSRNGRKASTMLVRRATCERAALAVEALSESLRSVEHRLAGIDASGLLGWHPSIHERPLDCALSDMARSMSCTDALAVVHEGNVAQFLPEMMTLKSQAAYDTDLNDFHILLLGSLDGDIARVFHNANTVLKEVWDGLVERAWNENGEMTPADYLFRFMGGNLWSGIHIDRMNWMLSGMSRHRLQAAIVYGELVDLLMLPRLTSMVDAGRSIQSELLGMMKISSATLRTMVGTRSLDILLLRDIDLKRAPTSYPDLVHMLVAWLVPETSWPRTPQEWQVMTHVRWMTPPHKLVNAQDMLSPHYIHAMSEHGVLDGQCKDTLNFVRDVLIHQVGYPLSCAHISACIAGDRSAVNIRKRLERLHDRLPVLNSLRQHLLGRSVSWEPACEPWFDVETGLQVTPIASTAELAEEGARMHHCVGGYDEECMDGSSIIFSVRLFDERIATLEILDTRSYQAMPKDIQAGLVARRSRLKFGQLSEVANRCAQSTVNAACRRFYDALLQGTHPLWMGRARMHQGNAGRVASYEQIASAMFPDISRILMPEWRNATWPEWLRAMK